VLKKVGKKFKLLRKSQTENRRLKQNLTEPRFTSLRAHATPLPNTIPASSLDAVAKKLFYITPLKNVRIGCHTSIRIATS
jgi:hypothetical protein